MRHLFFYFGLIILSSCAKDTPCGCDAIVGKTYFLNIDIRDCDTVDDIHYRKDGYIDLLRFGAGYNGERMEKIMKYEIIGDCKIRFHSLDRSKILPTKDCTTFEISQIAGFSNKTEDIVDLSFLTCHTYNQGWWTYHDKNPR